MPWNPRSRIGPQECIESLEATIAQQAAWLEAFRELVIAYDNWIHYPDEGSEFGERLDAMYAARAAIPAEAMGEDE